LNAPRPEPRTRGHESQKHELAIPTAQIQDALMGPEKGTHFLTVSTWPPDCCACKMQSSLAHNTNLHASLLGLAGTYRSHVFGSGCRGSCWLFGENYWCPVLSSTVHVHLFRWLCLSQWPRTISTGHRACASGTTNEQLHERV
jgi:hypothetical protein